MIKFTRKTDAALTERWGLANWLLNLLRSRRVRSEQRKPRLALVDRIALAPSQSLALIEAEGRRFLVATSLEGGSVFYPLDNSVKTDTSAEAPSSQIVRSANVCPPRVSRFERPRASW